jgi:hypothetical protein
MRPNTVHEREMIPIAGAGAPDPTSKLDAVAGCLAAPLSAPFGALFAPEVRTRAPLRTR